ncbi:AraC family transcriptional regulator [Bacillus sp. FJAT-28004]|uniref:AraC family transcriptional regulator n=1 Tax=Bacillus sp. FJAT-28004 TaxID=1679165 RepID=UPI0006B542D1|nr:AraC family transcriptional regulator [Bacillus sp. FJAT-28004]
MQNNIKNMKRQFLFNKRTFLVSFVLPYLFILLVPVMIGCVFFFKTLEVIKQEINRADEAIIKQIQQNIDSRLRDIGQLTNRVGIDSRVKALMNTRTSLDTNQRYTNYGLFKEFETYKLSNQFLSQFYVYFNYTDMILSTNGVFNSEAFYRQFYSSYNMGSREWDSFIKGYHSNQYLPLDMNGQDADASGRTIVFATSLVPYISKNPEKPLATIFIQLNNAIFESAFKTMDSSDGKTFSIINSSNQLIYTTGQPTDYKELNYDGLSDLGVTHVKLNGKNMTVSSIPSEITDWKYVSAIPSNLFMYKAVVIRNLALSGMILIFVLGGVLTYLFSRKNYGPLRKLLNVIGEKSGILPKVHCNEYKFIEEMVSNIVEEKQSVEEKYRLQKETLRDHFLIRLMKGNQDCSISISDLSDAYNIKFESNHYALLLFYLENTSTSNVTHEPVHFIMKNVMEDYLRQHNNIGFVLEVDQFMVCLVNIKEHDKTKQKDEVIEIAEQAIQLFANRIGIICSVSISRLYSKLEDIKLAYNETIEAIEYKLIFGSESIIHYEDIQTSEQGSMNYDFSVVKEYQFANCIKVGDYQSAKQVISETIVNNSKQVPINIVKCNMFALIHTVITSLSGISIKLEKEFLEILNPIDRLLHCKTLPQLELEIFAIIDEIEQYVVGTDKSNKSTLIAEIMSFTHCNYHNSDLNVSMISEQFHVSLPYLSKMFKQHAGEGLLEYIQKVRVQKAKEMMAANDCTIKEVASRVGFTNRDTLIRLFKKYEGVTPGKFKG